MILGVAKLKKRLSELQQKRWAGIAELCEEKISNNIICKLPKVVVCVRRAQFQIASAVQGYSFWTLHFLDFITCFLRTLLQCWYSMSLLHVIASIEDTVRDPQRLTQMENCISRNKVAILQYLGTNEVLENFNGNILSCVSSSIVQAVLWLFFFKRAELPCTAYSQSKTVCFSGSRTYTQEKTSYSCNHLSFLDWSTYLIFIKGLTMQTFFEIYVKIATNKILKFEIRARSFWQYLYVTSCQKTEIKFNMILF